MVGLKLIAVSLKDPGENFTSFMFAKHLQGFAGLCSFPPGESVGLLTFLGLASPKGKDTMQPCS